MVGNFSGLGRAASVERRAGKIRDPIERLRYLRRAARPRRPRHWPFRWTAFVSLAAIMLAASLYADFRGQRTAGPPPPAIHHAAFRRGPDVWVVEQTNDYELYSNGLRLDCSYSVGASPRFYVPVRRAPERPSAPRPTGPAGIVFHTTESELVPFEPSHNVALRRVGRELLAYLRDKRAYHFLIDRFGGVHRIVRETDAANHAGHSVWADSQWIYLDLNSSFLGVAFEAQGAAGGMPANSAQVHSARVLTEMLRSRYGLKAENLVVHAQVSVNPEKMLIGWHTDWGARFPFAEIGLPDNYEQPNPSLLLFGFDYDTAYVKATGPDLWKGLAMAEYRLREAAARREMPVAQLKDTLRARYRTYAADRGEGGNF